MKLYGNFAILDVKHGRVGLMEYLRKRLKDPKPKPVPITIKGHIVSPYSKDDGTSREFEVRVDSIEVKD